MGFIVGAGLVIVEHPELEFLPIITPYPFSRGAGAELFSALVGAQAIEGHF